MTSELIVPISIVMCALIVVGVIAAGMLGRRYGERRERQRHAQSETVTAMSQLHTEQQRSGADTRERLQRIEGNLDNRLQRIERILEQRQQQEQPPQPAAVPSAPGAGGEPTPQG